MNSNNISFTSRINFVDKRTYLKLRKGTYIDFVNSNNSIQKADEFYTENIRTCSAGGLVDTEGFEALGFHYRNCLINFNNIMSYLDRMFKIIKNPNKAFLIGSKNLPASPYSLEQFQRIKDIFKMRVDEVTVFEQHKQPYSETNIHYSLPNDRWDIYSMYRINSAPYDVLSKEGIKDCFVTSQLANNDYITFEKMKGDSLII